MQKKRFMATLFAGSLVSTASAKASTGAAVAGSVSRDWVLLLTTGLGISFAPHEYLGGLFMGLSAAMVANHAHTKISSSPIVFRWWIVYLSAFICSTVAGVSTNAWLPGYAPQIPMMMGGAMSLFLVRAFSRGMAKWESDSTDKIARRVDRVLGLDDLPPPQQPNPEEGPPHA